MGFMMGLVGTAGNSEPSPVRLVPAHQSDAGECLSRAIRVFRWKPAPAASYDPQPTRIGEVSKRPSRDKLRKCQKNKCAHVENQPGSRPI